MRAKNKRWTKARVKAVVRAAMREHGLHGEVSRVDWLGVWSRPKFGGGPDFRCVRVTIVSPGGRAAVKAVTIERNGGYTIR